MEQLRTKILELTKEYYKKYHEERNNSFSEGKDIVTFAGRVYDEEEMMNLVDSSLDFWLTTGRYAQEFEIEFAKYMQKKILSTYYFRLICEFTGFNCTYFSASWQKKTKKR